MGDYVVEVADLQVRYRAAGTRRAAVDGLSLLVEPGTVTAVLGPNGAGKTTTLETCEGYRRPHAGSVRVLGLDPIGDRSRLLPRIGVMLAEGGAWPTVRPAEMLTHLARMYAHPLPVGPLLERVGLIGAAATPYRRLSTGEKQRLGLAMAVIGRPELVFLDEPTTGLDPHGRRIALELIRSLREAGVSVVLSTHSMIDVEELADQVYVIDHGRVIAAGTPLELTSSGSAENTLRFRGPTGLDLVSLRAALPEDCRVTEAPPGWYVIAGTIDPGLLATVTAWCAGAGVLAEQLTVGRTTLEDVFLDLTGRKLRE